MGVGNRCCERIISLCKINKKKRRKSKLLSLLLFFFFFFNSVRLRSDLHWEVDKTVVLSLLFSSLFHFSALRRPSGEVPLCALHCCARREVVVTLYISSSFFFF